MRVRPHGLVWYVLYALACVTLTVLTKGAEHGTILFGFFVCGLIGYAVGRTEDRR